MLITRILLYLICFSSVIFAQSKLGEVQKNFNALKNFQVNFVQLQNGKEVLSGTFTYRNPGKMRLEMKNYVMITDGNDVWNYSKKQNKVIISKFNEADASMLSLEKVINDYPSKCKVTESSTGGVNEIKLVPRDNSLNFTEAVITAPPGGLINSMTIKSGTSVFEVRLNRYSTNINLPDDNFTFTPSERTKVIDLR